MIAPIILAYAMIVLVWFLINWITLLEDTNTSFRYALFWPLYAIRWLVENILLAIKGL